MQLFERSVGPDSSDCFRIWVSLRVQTEQRAFIKKQASFIGNIKLTTCLVSLWTQWRWFDRLSLWLVLQRCYCCCCCCCWRKMKWRGRVLVEQLHMKITEVCFAAVLLLLLFCINLTSSCTLCSLFVLMIKRCFSRHWRKQMTTFHEKLSDHFHFKCWNI